MLLQLASMSFCINKSRTLSKLSPITAKIKGVALNTLVQFHK